MLSEIGYLVPPGPSFTIATAGVDPEIAEVAGPQLVVPVTNARYALNAANARWGSLYDALYGTDAIGDPSPPGPYDPERGGRVIAWVRQFLDDVVPLDGASHADAVAYRVVDGELGVARSAGGMAGLADPASFAGHRGDASAPSAVLLEHHGLGIEIVIDREHPVGRDDPAGVADVVLESAVTAIIDCEDSVAAVDGADKTVAYRNWLGLMTGGLTAPVDKGGALVHPDARSGPRLHGSGWLADRPPGPRPAAGAQRRPPDDDPGGPRCRRPRDPGGPARRARDGAVRHARRRAPTRRCTCAPGRSTSSSRRCTVPTRSPSPTRCSAASRTCSGSRATP